jgi:sulfate-transporting ATPase
MVIDAKGVTKSFGDKLLFENFSFNIPPAGIVGIIGANGVGKSTLLPHDHRIKKNPISGSKSNLASSVKVGLCRPVAFDALTMINLSVWETICRWSE